MDHHFFCLFASVAELADALDLGSSVLRRAGSIPVTRTNSIYAAFEIFSRRPFFSLVSFDSHFDSLNEIKN